ncbi:ATP-dependent helicase rhp16 [Silene latifolia]|uniref:ATP-dependent helicase rhp16 n=1 Tax=Silene latifolia TaxID=37657 RepID=UPI003D779CB6
MELRSKRRVSSSPILDAVVQPIEPDDMYQEHESIVDVGSDHSDSSSDGDFDASAELLDLNEAPDVDDSSVESDDEVVKSSVRKRKKPPVKKSEKCSKKKEKKNKEGSDVEGDTNVPSVESFEGISGFEFVDPFAMKKLLKKKKNGDFREMFMWDIWEEEHRLWIDNYMSKELNLDQQNEMMDETHKEPSELLARLLRFQKEWLSWALKQEESPIKGGILADEMGMGKTVQAIALVLAKREIQRATSGVGRSLSPPSSSSVLPEVKCTLVICPASALHQWQREIERFTREGSTKVLCYQGPKRVKNSILFFAYDFIITTYNTIEADYRKVMPPKQQCRWCGRSLYERKMAIHLKYYCGPNALKTEKQSKQDSKRKKSHKVSRKHKDVSDDKHVDKRKSGEGCSDENNPNAETGWEEDYLDEFEVDVRKSALHSVKWERIVLDEAHCIKDRRSNTARAVLALESSYKWALSGTPLQNRVGELYSLIRFLQIAPYSYYLCKDCDCMTLDYSMSAECKNCEHKAVRHFCWWNKNVATPIQACGNKAGGKRAMILLRHKILDSILLRRTKSGRASDLALPPRIISLRRDTLDVKEEDYYQSLYTESQAQFNTYVTKGTLMNNYAHIFDLLTRLRQAVDHPYLVVYSRTNSLRNESVVETDTVEQACGICHDPAEDLVVTSCGHTFCKTCLLDFSSALEEPLCPSCSKPLTADFTSKPSTASHRAKSKVKGFRSSSILNRIRLDDFQTSTKIDALREEIRFMIERDGSAKGIVFSQFTSFLDLIMYSLQKSGITCVLLEGSMTITARDNVIKRFHEDPDCTIFLISLKAGGVALNLTVASHVFLMDPWWNPAAERQAMDRIHRIGQFKPIRIVRFVIENTIEERILKLQEKKELVFEGTVGGSSDALAKLTEADLKFLFVT